LSSKAECPLDTARRARPRKFRALDFNDYPLGRLDDCSEQRATREQATERVTSLLETPFEADRMRLFDALQASCRVNILAASVAQGNHIDQQLMGELS
jgi:hypothetical protein